MDIRNRDDSRGWWSRWGSTVFPILIIGSSIAGFIYLCRQEKKRYRIRQATTFYTVVSLGQRWEHVNNLTTFRDTVSFTDRDGHQVVVNGPSVYTRE